MGVVYFIQGETTKLIKIGHCDSAGNIKQRLADLQCGSPDKLKVIGIALETPEIGENALHTAFAKFWSHGEWFYPDSLLLDFISKYTSVGTDYMGEVWSKHRRLKRLQSDFTFKDSAALRAYVKEKVSEKGNVPN